MQTQDLVVLILVVFVIVAIVTQRVCSATIDNLDTVGPANVPIVYKLPEPPLRACRCKIRPHAGYDCGNDGLVAVSCKDTTNGLCCTRECPEECR